MARRRHIGGGKLQTTGDGTVTKFFFKADHAREIDHHIDYFGARPMHPTWRTRLFPSSATVLPPAPTKRHAS
jgi:hypothetical protein